MKLQLNCAGNHNVANGKTYSYIHKPVGDGKWMAIKEYCVVNCLAQDIELRQEFNGGPILSPFGAHNVTLQTETIVINHNTIVWHKPNEGYITHNCKPKTQFKSTGRISRITVEDNKIRPNKNNMTKTGRLLDSEKQIEILFNTTSISICTNIHNAYKITGIPDTYLVFNESIDKFFPPETQAKSRNKRQTFSDEEDHVFSLAWGHINPLSFFPPSEEDEKFDNKAYVLTTSNVENPLFLMPRVPPFNETVWHELGIWPDTQQQFTHSADQSISFTKNGNRYCLSVNKPNHLLFKDCSISDSSWIYDSYRMYIMDANTRGCLTAVKDKVDLLPCEMEPHSIKQMWKFDNRNTDATFNRAYPNVTIEEWEFVQEELKSRPAESVTGMDELFNWGNLIQKTKKKSDNPQQSCMTHSKDMRTVYIETCTRQDKEFSQQNQMFEYATDYTIRKFKSNMCLKIDAGTATLEKCSENSIRWGTNKLTGQIMEVRTIKCIENNKGKLQLGLCSNDQKPRNQKWKFEFHNPMPFKSTDTPKITPDIILQWHRSFSIHNIPIPPLPTVIQRPNESKTFIEQPTIQPDLLPDTTHPENNPVQEIHSIKMPQPDTANSTTTTTTSTTTTATTPTKTSTTTAPTSKQISPTVKLLETIDRPNISAPAKHPPSPPFPTIKETPATPTYTYSHLQRKTAPKLEMESLHWNQSSAVNPRRVHENIEDLDYYATSTATYPNMTKPTAMPVQKESKEINSYLNDSTQKNPSRNVTLP